MSFNLTIHVLPQFPLKNNTNTTVIKQFPIQSSSISASISQNPNPKTPSRLSNHLLSLAIAFVTLTSPPSSPAIPSLNNPLPPPNLPPATTPFSQSKNLITGLDNGKIRPCPSNNPGCVSSNPKSSSFSFPWRIPDKFLDNALQQLQEAILDTQKNAKIEIVEDTPDGQYLQATVDGGFGRDVLEFLVKGDVVSYRCMASKVTYVYPFTTALGDSKGQEERIRRIVDQLGKLAGKKNREFLDEKLIRGKTDNIMARLGMLQRISKPGPGRCVTEDNGLLKRGGDVSLESVEEENKVFLIRK